MPSFFVTADHILPQFRLVGHLVTVREDSQRDGSVEYYATAPRLGVGCGKGYTTPAAAIYSLVLVRDHAYTNIRIVEREGEAEADETEGA